MYVGLDVIVFEYIPHGVERPVERLAELTVWLDIVGCQLAPHGIHDRGGDSRKGSPWLVASQRPCAYIASRAAIPIGEEPAKRPYVDLQGTTCTSIKDVRSAL